MSPRFFDKYIPHIQSFVKFYVGRNAQENFDIIDIGKTHTSLGQNKSLWFHIANSPSNHVVAVFPIDTKFLDKRQLHYVVKQGAVLCKAHSKMAQNKNVEIIWTFIDNVEKTDILGAVSTKNTKSVII
jgi:predicted ribosome quality control (RQC) complex YloA/Tae2 family protein